MTPYDNDNANHPGFPWRRFYPPQSNADLGPLPWQNLREMLHKTAKRHASRPAYTTVLPNGFTATQTFREVDTLSDHFAAYLRLHLKLDKGDRVAVQVPNCPAWPICVFGILKAGCVLVNANPLYTEHEMEHLLNDSGAKVLVVVDLFTGKLDATVPMTIVQNVVIAGLADFFPFPQKALVNASLRFKKQIGKTQIATTALSEALAIGHQRFEAIRPWDRGAWGPAPTVTPDNSVTIRPDDIAVLQYTGGTTGSSKAAIITHANIISNMQQVVEIGRPCLEAGHDTILTALPLYHVFAFTVNGLTFYSLGAHNVLVPNPRPIANLKPAFEKYAFTWLTGVNTLYNALVNEEWFAAKPPRSLKVAIAGGTALMAAVAEKWQRVVGTRLVEGYGLTEASPVVCFNPITGEARQGSVGVPLASTEVRIVDDEGRPVPQGERGEMVVQGPQVMRGYWNQPSETAQVMREGWLYTGDIGYMDSDGFFFIVDRKKDMILVSGFNVYPNEVEDCLVAHPDVREAAVVGIPDDVTGEQIHAYIVVTRKDLTPAELKSHCRRYLTGYKVPRVFVFREELPKSNVGKILRKEVRKEALAASCGSHKEVK